MRRLYEILKRKYDLSELLEGGLDIYDLLDDVDVSDFLSYSDYTLEDIEDYILHELEL